jgi:hypothetical protein
MDGKSLLHICSKARPGDSRRLSHSQTWRNLGNSMEIVRARLGLQLISGCAALKQHWTAS